jgi:hypothetical protein
MAQLYRAAYVPELDRDRDAAARPASEWIENEAARRGTTAVLVTAGGDHAPSLQSLLDRGAELVAPRSRKHHPNPGLRPTVAYAPDEDLLEQAAGYAAGTALCAVEGRSFRLGGWAAATNAIDLDTGLATAAPAAEVAALLGELEGHATNGFVDIPGKRAAPRLLAELRRVAPDLDGAYLAGWLIGKGRSARAGRTIRDLAGR